MLVDLTVKEYIEVLGSSAPAPGGGSAAALSGAQGTALIAMVCELTIGKKKYEQFNDLNKEALKDITVCKNNFIDFIDKDTQAFNLVSDVFKMPKDTDEEKEKRKIAMQTALKTASQVPFTVMEESLKAISIAKKLIGCSNTNALSDIGVGVLNLEICAKGAWLNVLINLSGIKDEKFVSDYKNRGTKIVKEIEKNGKEIFDIIEKELG